MSGLGGQVEGLGVEGAVDDKAVMNEDSIGSVASHRLGREGERASPAKRNPSPSEGSLQYNIISVVTDVAGGGGNAGDAEVASRTQGAGAGAGAGSSAACTAAPEPLASSSGSGAGRTAGSDADSAGCGAGASSAPQGAAAGSAPTAGTAADASDVAAQTSSAVAAPPAKAADPLPAPPPISGRMRSDSLSGLKGPAKRLQKELAEMEALSEGCANAIAAGPKGDDLFNWEATIAGPEGSPYEGGIFHLDVSFPVDYPFKPMKIHFKTRVYHCGITPSGMCLEVLKEGWSPRVTLPKVLLQISGLLSEPDTSHPLESNIAHEYLNDRAKHDATAREWTRRYAMPAAAAAAAAASSGAGAGSG